MFRLAQISLRNRAVVLLASIAIVVGGVAAVISLKQELIPSMNIPMAVVISTDPGAAPEVIEQQVGQPVEAAIRGVQGVQSINTTATGSAVFSVVEFDYGTDMDIANNRLTTAVSRISSQLPSGVQTQVMTGSMDDMPVIQLAVAAAPGQTLAPGALDQAVDELLIPRLRVLPDIRDITVSGQSPQAITVTLDPLAMAAHGVSASTVADVLKNNGLTFPVGRLTEGDQTLTVQGGQPLSSAADLAGLPLVSAPGAPLVRLSDVASVSQGAEAATSYSRLNGSDAIALAVTKTPAGNTVQVSHAIQDELDSLSEVLADLGLTVAVVFDQAPFIERSIASLAEEGLLGLGFAVIVILVFLFSIRSTLVSAVSIPLSVLTALIVMRATGETLNLITLSALTIAIGRVVDDAIVVIENIKRHLSYGERKLDAIVGAVREVAGAITASTVCTVAVFAPIGFVGGMVGQIFRPFAITVAIALLASLVVALTIVPVLAYWFVKSPVHIDQADLAEQRAQAEDKERHGLLQRIYLPTLKAALKHPVVTLSIALGLLAGTAGLATQLETNFMGSTGQDTVTVTQTFLPSTALGVQDDEARVIEDRLRQMPEIATVQTSVGGGGSMSSLSLGGSNQATFSLTLAAEADATTAVDTIRAAVSALGGPRTSEITVGGAEAMMGTQSIDLIIRATNPEALAEAAAAVEQVARQTEGTTDVTNNLAEDQDTVAIRVDRERAAAAGLTESQILGLVAGLMTPSSIGAIDTAEGSLDVRLAMSAGPSSIEQLRLLPLAAGPMGAVTLGDLAEVELARTPVSLTRVDGERSATVSVTPSTQDLGQISGQLEDAVDQLDLPPGVTVEVGGLAALQSDTFSDLGLALLIAIAIVFIVMVATFGSLLQPFILLISIPLAATGALAALLLTGTPLGAPALIGVLMLIGVVVSNAIVLIDLINQYRRRGRALEEAMVEGARKRLRPILMTAAATIFALTPMAIGLSGNGSFLSQPLALVVIGGLVSSTLLTLIVVPVLYGFEARAHDRREAKREARLEQRRAERARQRQERLAAG
ncbi:MAG: efflux RND transporter permease subunit [Propionibacteriaceae bacterium]|jgi:HAE1 family hydrophobic/amphiphilic exporter-1|nr:efflux RND transporter permease subunit [Propionibacteriaceae bacterium]